jgi:hypothetical protein
VGKKNIKKQHVRTLLGVLQDPFWISGNMSSAAVSAMKQLGATKIDRDMASSVGSVGGGYEMDNLSSSEG